MSATELDVPVSASAEQIRRREFASVRRGYDPDQVRDYLEQIAIQIERMEQVAREARLEAEAAHRASFEPRADPYEEFASRMSDLMRAADQQADRIRGEAKQEADRVIAEARADADRISLDAQSKAEEARSEGERALHEARERADRTVAGLATKRESLVEQLQTMQERLLGVARDLEVAIEPGSAERTTTAGEVSLPRAEISRPEQDASAVSAGPDATAIIDPRYEDLWASNETIDLTIPDIPPLDLGFEDIEGEDLEGLEGPQEND
jgi:cell division initiation protein